MGKEFGTEFQVDKVKSTAFYVLLIVMALLGFANIYRGYLNFSPNATFGAYDWYPYTTMALAVLMLFGVILLYKLKKVGLYLIVGALFVDIVQQPEFGMWGTLSSVFALFIMLGYGLVVVIPRWSYLS